MTRLEIGPWSPGPLANTLQTKIHTHTHTDTHTQTHTHALHTFSHYINAKTQYLKIVTKMCMKFCVLSVHTQEEINTYTYPIEKIAVIYTHCIFISYLHTYVYVCKYMHLEVHFFVLRHSMSSHNSNLKVVSSS